MTLDAVGVLERVETIKQGGDDVPLSFCTCFRSVKPFTEGDGGLFKFDDLCFEVCEPVIC